MGVGFGKDKKWKKIDKKHFMLDTAHITSFQTYLGQLNPQWPQHWL